MKKQFLSMILIIGLFGIGCDDPKPEFSKNGKGYYTKNRCVKSHNETVWDYHWGYSWMRGKYCWHYGPHSKTICDQSIIDTIQLKQ
mgnify:CR=1 FL=1